MPLPLVIASILLLASQLHAEVKPLSALTPCRILITSKAKPTGDTLSCLKADKSYFADLGNLVRRVGGVALRQGDSLQVVFGAKVFNFKLGSRFVKLDDGTFWQMPWPVEELDNRLYVYLNSAAELIASRIEAEIKCSEPEAAAVAPPPPPPGKPVVATKKADHSMWDIDLVVIDAGHGGKDPGAIGPSGLKEKTVTLDVAQRLNKFLQSKGVKTVMTRDDDVFIPLSERTGIANRSSGKLFISLHCNAAKQKKAGGVETYFLAPSKTERATEVALLENEAIKFEEKTEQYKALTEENYILMTMTQATFTQESEDLAGLVQEALTKETGLRNRGVDQAGFYVLIGASMPAILFEMAFISNKSEEKKLKDKKFKQRIAEEIGETVIQFLQIPR